MLFEILAFVTLAQPPERTSYFGENAGLKLTRMNNEVVEEIYAKAPNGDFELIAVSPTHSLANNQKSISQPNSISRGNSGLFAEPPSHRFQKFETLNGGTTFKLVADAGDQMIEKVVEVPSTGNTFRITVSCTFVSESPSIQYFLDSYAFLPGGKPQRPDSTFAPGLRPKDANVIGDHFFRAPVVVAQHAQNALLIIPDLEHLKLNRLMPTIIDLDAKSGATKATLLSYGFCNQRLSSHVAYETDPSLARAVPKTLQFSYAMIATATAKERKAYALANDFLWERFGSNHFATGLPQVMPFYNYAAAGYRAAIKEQYGENVLGWTERKVVVAGKNVIAGWIPSGWGFTSGWVSWQCWFNQLRSAWGLKLWARISGSSDFEERADKMMNLALSAPMQQGAVPTTFDGRKGVWKGSLIQPTSECEYDLPSIAWKGIWMLRWIKDFPNDPRIQEIERQCMAMAQLMLSKQNVDGSFPSWLTKDLRPVPILDRSAQSALPAWFLGEFHFTPSLKNAIPESKVKQALLSAGDFLLREVVDQQRYYDFETFFSCSPKPCLAKDGKIDDTAMHDPHTLQPPQNTLCMQWTAEALLLAKKVSGESRYREGAEKALEMLILYQNVWPISFRQVANTFGGFGVQNSDGEYNDARQAQFGSTLMKFGAEFGRKDWFERGVAAIRASMTLMNHPLHILNEIYPNPNYPLGLMPENCGHGGTDQQNGRTGFDWGEGSGLASLAEALLLYGGVFVHDVAGWSVGVDGVQADRTGDSVTSTVAGLAYGWSGNQPITVRFASGREPRNIQARQPIKIRRMEPFWEADQVKVVAYPAWTSNSGATLQARFVIGEKSFTASLADRGIVAVVPADALRSGPIRLMGTFNGSPIACEASKLYVDPQFTFESFQLPPDWRNVSDFPIVPFASTRTDFNNQNQPFIGTCEDGRGGFDDSYTGTITSPPFLATSQSMEVWVGGGSGEGTYVELIDATTGDSLAVARGKNAERMELIQWELVPHIGKLLKIRIVDRAKGAWGHINVGRISVGTHQANR